MEKVIEKIDNVVLALNDLKTILNNHNKKKFDLDYVIDRSCIFFAIEKELLLSHDRKKNVSDCRSYIVYYCRLNTNYSYMQIADALNRDHSNMIHHYNKMDGLVQWSAEDKIKYKQYVSFVELGFNKEINLL